MAVSSSQSRPAADANAAQPSAAARAPSILPVPNQRLRALWSTRSGRAALTLIAEYFHATLEGGEHIPAYGGALIVANHSLFALDTAALAALIIRDLRRHPRFLADRALWKVPGLGRAITAIGALPGAPDAAIELLSAGELVIVYPGGVDDSLKLSRERYELKWKARAGFAKVAMSARVPIIPIVGFGIDEAYTVLAREHWLGRRLFGNQRYDMPIFLGAYGTIVPRRAPMHFIALPPIDTRGDPSDPSEVERVRAATFDALEQHLRAIRHAHHVGR
jgi:1-acyl-sn-glycerol-3-phosphate acyltransferase